MAKVSPDETLIPRLGGLAPTGDGDGLRVVARVMTLLRSLAAAAPEPRRLVDLTADSGLHKATARRLLSALAAEGLVERTARGFELGPEAWLLGQAAATRFDLRDVAAASLRRIADETDDVALLSIIVGTNAHCIARTEGNHPILPTSIRPGAVRPLGCGGHALALLAALPDEQVARIVAMTSDERERDYPAITDEYLRRKVSETRRDGFASAGGEIVKGMAALSMVAFDPWQRPIAALTCTAIASRLQAERRAGVVTLLREEVRQIEARFRRTVGAGPAS